MSVITVSKDELFGIVQYINIIRAKFHTDDVWTLYPVLYSSFDSMDIISDEKNLSNAKIGYKVCFKFQKQGYEYIVDGEVVDISQKSSPTVTIRFLDAKKYYNLRKYIRFEVNLCSEVQGSLNDGQPCNEQCSKATVMNLSKGGAMAATKAEFMINDVIDFAVSFESGLCFKSKAQILRKQNMQNEGYNYGLQFIHTSEDDSRNLNNEIGKLEKAYFSSLREYKKSESEFDAKFAIFSSDIDESYDIREALVKLGAENFDVINNFKFYIGFMAEEKPKFIIIDLSIMDDDVANLIENIKTDFPQVGILLILPIAYQQDGEYINVIDKLDVLYKPLIYNEFEDRIIKYL